MTEVKMVLPNLASDTAGAASALFSLGGLTVIHDAAGSLEVFLTYEEARSLDGRRTVGSTLNRLDAITGNDQSLVDRIVSECETNPPNFVAIIGSPVPFTIGTDLEGIAAEVETITGIPAFGVTAGGFDTYESGVGDALKKLVQKLTVTPAPHEGYIVNLLGVTPMDYSPAEIQGICNHLKTQGAAQVRTLTMTEGVDEIIHAAEADLNLVISNSGMAAAKLMKRKFGIPYSIGVPMELPKIKNKKILVLGESVFAKQLTENLICVGCDATAGIIGMDHKEIFPQVPCLPMNTEEKIQAELKKDYDLILSDGLYRLLLSESRDTVYITRPHRGLSGRLYEPAQETLDQFLEKL